MALKKSEEIELIKEKKGTSLKLFLNKKRLILALGFALLSASGAGTVSFFFPEVIPSFFMLEDGKEEAMDMDEEDSEETEEIKDVPKIEQPEKRAEPEKPKEPEKGKNPEKLTRGHIYSMDPLIANLANPEKIRYLKVRINMESAEEKPNDEYEKRIPQIRDTILTVLSAKVQKDIMSAEGKNNLREEITAQVNQVLVQFQIKTVYFTEFIIQ